MRGTCQGNTRREGRRVGKEKREEKNTERVQREGLKFMYKNTTLLGGGAHQTIPQREKLAGALC